MIETESTGLSDMDSRFDGPAVLLPAQAIRPARARFDGELVRIALPPYLVPPSIILGATQDDRFQRVVSDVAAPRASPCNTQLPTIQMTWSSW